MKRYVAIVTITFLLAVLALAPVQAQADPGTRSNISVVQDINNPSLSGKVMAHSDRANNMSVEGSDLGYALDLNISSTNHSGTEIYVQKQAIQAVTGFDFYNIYVDGERISYHETSIGNSPWVTFDIPHFSTRNVTITGNYELNFNIRSNSFSSNFDLPNQTYDSASVVVNGSGQGARSTTTTTSDWQGYTNISNISIGTSNISVVRNDSIIDNHSTNSPQNLVNMSVVGDNVELDVAEFNDSFESEPADSGVPDSWEIDTDAGASHSVSTARAYDGNQSYLIDGGSDFSLVSPSSQPLSNKSTEKLSYAVYIDSNRHLLRLYEGGTITLNMKLSSSGLEWFDGSSYNTISTEPTTGEWVFIEVSEIDPANDTCTVSWDSNAGSGSDTNVGFRNSMTDGYNETRFMQDQNKHYLDQVEIGPGSGSGSGSMQGPPHKRPNSTGGLVTFNVTNGSVDVSAHDNATGNQLASNTWTSGGTRLLTWDGSGVDEVYFNISVTNTTTTTTSFTLTEETVERHPSTATWTSDNHTILPEFGWMNFTKKKPYDIATGIIKTDNWNVTVERLAYNGSTNQFEVQDNSTYLDDNNAGTDILFNKSEHLDYDNNTWRTRITINDVQREDTLTFYDEGYGRNTTHFHTVTVNNNSHTVDAWLGPNDTRTINVTSDVQGGSNTIESDTHGNGTAELTTDWTNGSVVSTFTRYSFSEEWNVTYTSPRDGNTINLTYPFSETLYSVKSLLINSSQADTENYSFSGSDLTVNLNNMSENESRSIDAEGFYFTTRNGNVTMKDPSLYNFPVSTVFTVNDNSDLEMDLKRALEREHLYVNETGTWVHVDGDPSASANDYISVPSSEGTGDFLLTEQTDEIVEIDDATEAIEYRPLNMSTTRGNVSINASSTAEVTLRFEGLEADSEYNITFDGDNIDTKNSDSDGVLTYTYDDFGSIHTVGYDFSAEVTSVVEQVTGGGGGDAADRFFVVEPKEGQEAGEQADPFRWTLFLGLILLILALVFFYS